MSFSCKIGDTIFIDDNGGGHRYLVVTNPNKDGRVVVVNFTSASGCVDKTVTFTRSDNRKLFNNPTNVHYKYARAISKIKLLEEVNREDIVSDYILCEANIAKKVVVGAFQSQFTPIEIIEELRIQYPKEYKKYYR